MKRFITWILSLLLVASLAGNAFATDDGVVLTIGASETAFVVDDAELLNDSEEADLTRLAADVSKRQNCDVIILTVRSLDGKTPDAYADNFFEINERGYGSNRSGILFLLSMEERDWCIYRRGDDVRQAISFDGTDYLWTKCGSDFSNGAYASGFRRFLQAADTMLSAYHGTLSDAELNAFQNDFNAFLASRNDDPSRSSTQRPSIGKTTVIALVIGFLLAFLFSGSLRSQLKSVRMKYSASSYRRPDSMHLNQNRDVYLYANTTSRVIETQRSGGGPGSSPHTTNSTATHDSTSGKF